MKKLNFNEVKPKLYNFIFDNCIAWTVQFELINYSIIFY